MEYKRASPGHFRQYEFVSIHVHACDPVCITYRSAGGGAGGGGYSSGRETVWPNRVRLISGRHRFDSPLSSSPFSSEVLVCGHCLMRVTLPPHCLLLVKHSNVCRRCPSKCKIILVVGDGGVT